MRLSWLAFLPVSCALVAACSSHGAPDPEVLFDANTGAVGADSAPPNGADAGASEAAVSNDAGDSSVSVADAASMDAGVLDASMSDAARADAGSDGATTSDAGLDGAAADGASDAARDGASGDGASGDGSVSDAGIDAAPSPGPYAVGTMRIELVIDAQRTIPVQLWYPAVETARAEASQGHPTAEFEPPGARRDQLSTMLANSPDACTNKTMHGALGAEVASLPQPFPALVFSHCQDCVRFSTFTVSEHLASQGFVIAAPDHVRGTIYDATGLLDEAFLQTRSNDARKVIDLLLDGASSLLPAGLRGKIDPSRIGMYGHSYGSITTGRTLRDDARVKAGSMIAAPIDLGSPLNSVLPGAADVTKLKQPALFFEGLEDQALFTLFIDDNFARYPNPTWLVQLKDGGHWSFTDIAGFNGTFSSGCGTAVRQGTLFDNFSFVDIVRARNITKAYLAAFFMFELNGDASAKSYLDQATPVDLVTLKRRP